VLIETELKNIS